MLLVIWTVLTSWVLCLCLTSEGTLELATVLSSLFPAPATTRVLLQHRMHLHLPPLFFPYPLFLLTLLHLHTAHKLREMTVVSWIDCWLAKKKEACAFHWKYLMEGDISWPEICSNLTKQDIAWIYSICCKCIAAQNSQHICWLLWAARHLQQKFGQKWYGVLSFSAI